MSLWLLVAKEIVLTVRITILPANGEMTQE
jgi:hypothetical protein